MRSKFGVIFIILGVLLLIYPQLEKKTLDKKQEELIQAFLQIGDGIDYGEAPQLEKVEAAVDQEQSEKLDGARGIVRIPKVDLEMVIFEGSTEASLNKGVGMIEPEKEFGVNNVGLAGHRGIVYGKQFNRLDELEPDDEIEIQTKTERYEFVVVKTFVVDYTEVGVLTDKDEPYLTFVTCTPIGKSDTTDRLIVQAILKNRN